MSVYKLVAFLIFFVVGAKSNNVTNDVIILYNTTAPPWRDWKFKDYILKFKPSRVWEQISNSPTRRKINADEFERMFNGIDETDELLSLKVPNGNPKLIIDKDGRRQMKKKKKNIVLDRWAPPGDIGSDPYDKFNLKRRFLELMKQAIYQARNRMIIMQTYRFTYRRSSVYKMGFLMSKTDQAVKTFARYSFKAFMGCYYSRLRKSRFYYIDLAQSFERVLELWFEVELLIDLLLLNDQNCKRMLNQVMTNKKEAWQFVD
ncbi:unnamed protein product [Leptosia nina]|uniref:Uncharacterized protein n=1 Tax=Leptosia nina TaxID=320188 RepID=A0AAV1J751_9NEOP